MCITVQWINELGRHMRELGKNVHVVSWLGLGAGGGGGHWLFVVVVVVVLFICCCTA